MATMLLGILEDLNSEQLKKFQWNLCQGGDSFEAIPKSKMEKQNREKTVDLMVGKWPEEKKAVSITLEILRKMDENNLAKRLEVKSSGEAIKYKEKPEIWKKASQFKSDVTFKYSYLWTP